MDNSNNIKKSLDQILDDISKMSDEEIRKELDNLGSCKDCNALCCPDPDCWGQCQGMGSCFTCRRFQLDMFGIDEGNYIPPKKENRDE